LFADSELSGWAINIDVEDGVITMSGEVDTQEQKRKADILANTVAGAREIRNELQVRTEQQESGMTSPGGQDERTAENPTAAEDQRYFDKILQEEIERRFERDVRMSGADIQVNVVSGRVILWGTAQNEEQRRMAEEIAADVEGVQAVTNDIGIMQVIPPEQLDREGSQQQMTPEGGQQDQMSPESGQQDQMSPESEQADGRMQPVE